MNSYLHMFYIVILDVGKVRGIAIGVQQLEVHRDVVARHVVLLVVEEGTFEVDSYP